MLMMMHQLIDRYSREQNTPFKVTPPEAINAGFRRGHLSLGMPDDCPHANGRMDRCPPSHRNLSGFAFFLLAQGPLFGYFSILLILVEMIVIHRHIID